MIVASVAGFAALGPLGAYYGGALGAGLAGVCSPALATALAAGGAGFLQAILPGRLDKWLNNRKRDKEIALNHTIFKAIADAIAKLMIAESGPKCQGLAKFWERALRLTLDDPKRVAIIFHKANDLGNLGENMEAQVLRDLSDPKALEDLLWRDVCAYLISVYKRPKSIPCNIAQRASLNRLRPDTSVKEAQRCLEAMRQPIFEAMRLAYAQEVASNEVLRDKTFFYLLQATGASVERIEGAVAQLQADIANLLASDRDTVVRAFAGEPFQPLTEAIEKQTQLLRDIQGTVNRTEVTVNETYTQVKEIHEAVTQGAAFVLRTNLPPETGQAFVQREGLLADLHRRLLADNSVAATSVAAFGDGGVGKTVLTHLYARRYRDCYEHIVVLGCANHARLDALYADYHGHSDAHKTQEERAQRVLNALSRSAGKPHLLILDNVEDKAQFEKYGSDGWLPGEHCRILVTTRDPNVLPKSQLIVDQLTEEEALELLQQAVPDARLEDPDVQQVLADTHRIAVFVSAVVATMQADRSPDLPKYAAWLRNLPTAKLPAVEGYPHRAQDILDHLRASLHPAELRALDLAARLPESGFPRAWLEDLLAQDQGTDLEWGTNALGDPRPAAFYVASLVDRRLLAPVTSTLDPDALALHRVHHRRSLEAVSGEVADALLQRVWAYKGPLWESALQAMTDRDFARATVLWDGIVALSEGVRDLLEPQGRWDPALRNNLAAAYTNRGVALLGVPDVKAAVDAYGAAIAIMEALRDELEPQGRWDPKLRNDLAGAYMNRGNALAHVPDLKAAVGDYGRAIQIMEDLRELLEPQGRWDPALRNDLAGAYMNRGNARRGLPDLNAAVEDYGRAIRIREDLRELLEPLERWALERWDPGLRNDLASAYMNRGVALQHMPDLNAAVKDYGRAIRIREDLRKELEPQGRWDPELRNGLAGAYMNRGNALAHVPDLQAAVGDYGRAIGIMEGLRDLLEPQKRWDPKLRNDLAGAYMNRGNALAHVPDLKAAVGDYGRAIQIMEDLRELLEPQGRWDPALRNDLANAHVNRGNALEPEASDPALADYDQALAILVPLAARFADFALKALRAMALRYRLAAPDDPTDAEAIVRRCVEDTSPAARIAGRFDELVAMLVRALERNHPELAQRILDLAKGAE